MLLDVSTKEGYDIACALRGPDIDLPGLKALFTARLRALIGIKPVTVWTRDRSLSSVRQPLVGDSDETTWRWLELIDQEIDRSVGDLGINHWLVHLNVAFNTLAKTQEESAEEASQLADIAWDLFHRDWEAAKKGIREYAEAAGDE